MSVTRQLMDTIYFHSRKKILWKSMVPIKSLVINIFLNIFLYVQQKKAIHTGLEQLEGE